MDRKATFRFALRLLSLLLAAALLGLGAAGWYYSNLILGPDKLPGRTGQTVLARTGTTITLASTFKARRPGYWAIVWPGGFGKIGPILELEADRVVTHFEIVSGASPDTTSRLA